MKRRQEHLSDLQSLRDKIAKVTNEYEDRDDDDPNPPSGLATGRRTTRLLHLVQRCYV